MTAPAPEALRRVLLDHHPVVRSETGPLAGCRCGQVRLGQDVIAHVAEQIIAALPPSPSPTEVLAPLADDFDNGPLYAEATRYFADRDVDADGMDVARIIRAAAADPS